MEVQGADRVVQRREPARAPSATNQKTWADGKQVLEWFAQLNGILNKDGYTDQGRRASSICGRNWNSTATTSYLQGVRPAESAPSPRVGLTRDVCSPAILSV